MHRPLSPTPPPKRWLCPCLLIALCLLLCIHVSATSSDEQDSSEDYERVPEAFSELLNTLPEELTEDLPETLFSSSTGDVATGVREIGSFSFLLRRTLQTLHLSLEDAVRLLASILGLLLLSAVSAAARNAIGSETVGRAFAFTSSLVVLLLMVRMGWHGMEELRAYFERINAITAVLLPLNGVLYAIGGNVGAASASGAGLSIFLTLLEEVVGKSILPFCGVCIAFALIGALDPAPRVGSFLGTLKKNYTTALAFLMMLLNTVLATQTTLGGKGDSLAMRSARFAAGNLIPVIGGSVTELLRSVGVGIGYLRTTVGIATVLLLLLTLLPTLLRLYSLRIVWQLCASFAEILGCTGEKKLLDEFSSLNGYLIAAVLICSSVLILSTVLLIKSTVAIG